VRGKYRHDYDRVDGEKLIDMLEELELGLKPRTTFEVDLEFFKSFR
jgi:restriction system protein